MTDLPFREALEADYSDYSPRDTIQRVKSAVIQGIEALDARAKIHSTEYFNHSFAPDLVLRWADGRDRYVYVRLTSDVEATVDDIARVAAQKPIIFQVIPGELPAERIAHEAVQERAQRDATLVTNARGVEALANARQQDSVVGLLTGALAEHGRGVVDDRRAAAVTASVSQGFAGARELKVDAVVEAASVVDELLETVSAAKMHRLLQAVWIGSGGRSDLFPSRTEVGTELDDASLAFLLDQAEIADLEFWRRVSSGIDLARLGHLVGGSWSNLRWLITANLHRLEARVCHVVDAQQGLDEIGQDALAWVIHRGRLALRSQSFYAYVAELSADLQDIPGTGTDGISIEQLRARSAGRTTITSVWLADAREEVAFTSVLNEDVVQSGRIDAVATSLGGTRVRRARAILPGGKALVLDLASSSASSVTRATLSLAEIVGYGLPLLRELDDAVHAQLAELTYDPFAGTQESLFDEIADLGPDR